MDGGIPGKAECVAEGEGTLLFFESSRGALDLDNGDEQDQRSK